MKGDPRIAAQCPFCPHWCRPRPRRDENGYVKVTRTIAVLKNAMRAHITSAHPGVSQRRVGDELSKMAHALETVQLQLPGDEKPATRALIPCPVCPAKVQTWVDPETRNLGATAKDRLRQHLNFKHTELSLRQVSLFTAEATFRIVTIEEENGDRAGPSVGDPARGPALPPDLVAPSRPDEPAHAPGKVVQPINVPPIKVTVHTSNRRRLLEAQVAGQPE